MAEQKTGRQVPTTAFVLPYEKTLGIEAVELYEETKRTALPWQKILTNDLMAINDDGLWVHQEFDYSIPRRNGKGEILCIRELWGLEHGEKIAHTAHLANTSGAAANRLAQMLKDAGYREIFRPKQDENYTKTFKFEKQKGAQMIALYDENGELSGGQVFFRTRTGAGGLGEGYDLLIIDEAQEYTSSQQTALQYTITSSKNPQTIMCGTPPTEVSQGDVFQAQRKTILSGNGYNAAWCEWSVEKYPDDIFDTDLWYETSPSLGYTLTERAVRSEIKPDVPGNEKDFVIQRLGLWILVNQNSVITSEEWDSCKVENFSVYKKKLVSKIFVGVKYTKSENTVMAICIKDSEKKFFIEDIGCNPSKRGDFWIIKFLSVVKWQVLTVDGASGQKSLAEAMKAAKMKAPVFPKVAEVEQAYVEFERALHDGNIRHNAQPSLRECATNTAKRAIGTNGGWGYKSLKDNVDIGLLDACVLAFYGAYITKEVTQKRKTFSY